MVCVDEEVDLFLGHPRGEHAQVHAQAGVDALDAHGEAGRQPGGLVVDDEVRRVALAPEGIVREVHRPGIKRDNRLWLTSRRNPKYLHNAAATFNHYGYENNASLRVSILYPAPLRDTALEMGLPVTDSLYPHCILLVAEHPEITPSFLENCELFDLNGDRSGYVSTDSGPRLVGKKYRRGSALAQQIIPLTERTAANRSVVSA